MEWTGWKHTKLNLTATKNNFECIDDEGKYHNIKGIYRAITTGKILVLQLKKCIRKGCQLYANKIIENESAKLKTIVDQFPILKEFQDVFRDEIRGLPPKRYLDFTIDLSTPIS